MPRKAAVALVHVLLLWSAIPAAAQSRFTLSPYVGTLFLDGSCVYHEGGDCLGFAHGDPAGVLGAVASYELAPAWRVEATYARSSIDGVASRADPTGTSGVMPTDGPRGIPFGTVATLAHVTLRRSLVGTSRSDGFATGSVGRIGFDAGRGGRFADLLLGAGLGLRLGAGPIAVRTDARAFTQPCRDDRDPVDLACVDGSWLGHVELSGGVVLTFPGLGPAGSRGDGN